MTDRYLLCLNDMYKPHHEPGIMLDVAAIVLRVFVAEEAYTPNLPVREINGFLVAPPPTLFEVRYPRGLAGFESVSRAIAYNHVLLNHRSIARDDTLVLVSPRYLTLDWGTFGESPRYQLCLSRDGIETREGYSLQVSHCLYRPGEPLSEETHAKLQSELLDWSMPRPPRPPATLAERRAAAEAALKATEHEGRS